jgi:hypothetical protein
VVVTSSIASIQSTFAQMKSSNITGGSMMAYGHKNQTNMMMAPNITGSVAIGPTLAKAIASQVHVSLANASVIAEKAVGANAHSTAVRIGVVHGFLVYMALVLDNSNNFHGVIVDAGNGKVLASTQMSMAAIMQGGMGMMGPQLAIPIQPGMMNGPGMMGPGMGMMGPGMGMMGPQLAIPIQPGMMNGPGMMSGYP